METFVHSVRPQSQGLCRTEAAVSLKAQGFTDDALSQRVELLPVLAPHLGGVHVGSALVVWLCQHADHRQQDLLHALHRAPALGTALVAHRVISWSVEDGDAHTPVWVDVGVEHVTGEPHLRGAQGVIGGETEHSRKHSAFKTCVLGPHDESLPFEEVLLVGWTCYDALWRIQGQLLVLRHEPLERSPGHGWS